MHPLFATSALTPPAAPHPLGLDRWMVWAPDKTDPEKMTIGHCAPTIEQMDFAIRLGRRLNTQNEDGTWLVSWSRPAISGQPTRLAWTWVDADGDINFTVDCEDGIAQMQASGVDHFAQQGFDAFTAWREHMREAEISPNQMIKRRLGQAPRDSRQTVPPDFG